MGQVLLLSLTASFNPTLVAATNVMLLLPSPSKLILGYLLGAVRDEHHARSCDRLLTVELERHQHDAEHPKSSETSRWGRSRWSLLGLSGAGAKNG
jgi:hypothetical protein